MPKPLLPVRGVPILVHILRKLRAEGWDRILVCVLDEHREQFEYHLDRADFLESVMLSSHANGPFGTAGELVNAARFIKDDYFLVFYGDILAHVDTGVMRRAYEGMSPRPVAFLAAAKTCRVDKGVVRYQGDEILEVQEKPSIELPNLVGIDIFRSDVLERVAIGEDLHRDVVPRLLGEDLSVQVHLVDDDFIDVGSVDAFRRAQAWR